MPVSSEEDCGDNRGDHRGRGWNEEAHSPPRMPDRSIDTWGESNTFEPGALKESSPEPAIGPGPCDIHEFTNRARSKRQAGTDQRTELLLGFLAFHAILGVSAQLH